MDPAVRERRTELEGKTFQSVPVSLSEKGSCVLTPKWSQAQGGSKRHVCVPNQK